jgi:uncharacterized protein (DUF2062 family)
MRRFSVARLRRRGLLGSIFAPFRYLWLRAARSPQGARYVAGGFSLGVFWACIPIFILHLPFALVTAYFLRKSRLAATAAVCLSNPLTIPPQYTLTWMVGNAVTSTSRGQDTPPFADVGNLGELMMDLAWSDLGTMLLGGTILGAVLSIPAYFVAFRLVQRRGGRRRAAGQESVPRSAEGGG